MRFPDGKVLDILGHAVPLFDSIGAVHGAVAAMLDITTLKKTEEELKRARAEAKLHADNMAAIFDTVPAAAFFSHDRSCERITSNRAAYDMLRMPYGEQTDPIESFDFEEFTPQAGLSGMLWGNPAVIAGLLLGATFSQQGSKMNPGSVLTLG